MTPRERAEKYSERFMFGWTTEERVTFFEEIIKDEIAACVAVQKGIGNFFDVLGHSMLDRVLKFKEGIEIEREECAKICDEFWDKHCQTETGSFIVPSGAARLAVNQVAEKIRARGNRNQQAAVTNPSPEDNG